MGLAMCAEVTMVCSSNCRLSECSYSCRLVSGISVGSLMADIACQQHVVKQNVGCHDGLDHLKPNLHNVMGISHTACPAIAGSGLSVPCYPSQCPDDCSEKAEQTICKLRSPFKGGQCDDRGYDHMPTKFPVKS